MLKEVSKGIFVGLGLIAIVVVIGSIVAQNLSHEGDGKDVEADDGTAASAKASGDEPVERGADAPEPAEEMRTVSVTPELARKGEKAYATCAGCHGPDGHGKLGTAPRLTSESFLAAASDQFLIDTIAEGREGTTMTGWSDSLGHEQIEAIVAYLRSQEKVEPAKLDHSPLDGDLEQGEKLFTDICSNCHGRQGGGYQETAPGTGIGRKAFLSAASDGYLRYITKHGKSQTPMRGFREKDKIAVANLSDQEIDSIISYLRENAW